MRGMWPQNLSRSCLKCALSLASVQEVGLDLVVENEHKGTTGSSDDVREGSLEESLGSLLFKDLGKAIHCACVLNVATLLARLHHQSSADGIKGVRDDTGGNGNELSETPDGEEVGRLDVVEQKNFAGVEHTEVGSAVSDDTDDRDAKTSVESLGAVRESDLAEAVYESVELAGFARTDVSSEAGTSEVEWVDDGEGGGTSSSTGHAVSEEELEGFLLGVIWAEDLLVEILASKVEGLGGEVTDYVGRVASPEGSETLFLGHAGEAVTNALVSVLWCDVLVGILNLQEELDTLDGGDEGLGDGS